MCRASCSHPVPVVTSIRNREMEGGNTIPDFRNYGVRASNLWTIVAMLTISLACVATAAFATNTASFDGTDYLIGVGSYDATGPAAGVNLMGYANPAQIAAGLHFRLRARAFIVADPAPDGERVVFVNLDSCMGEQAVTDEVVKKLKQRYGDMYTEKNVLISGIHTHSGPGGFLHHVLYVITSFGFVRQSFDALVNGVEKAIVIAHEHLQPGSIAINQGELLDTNINRSPSAYLNNPTEERAAYSHNVDKDMTLLKFSSANGTPVGALNWFPVHCVSMNRSNTLVSGDSKGAASRLFEDWQAGLGDHILQQRHAGEGEGEGEEGRGRRRRRKGMARFDANFDASEASSVASLHTRQRGAEVTHLTSRLFRLRNRHLSEAGRQPPFVAAFATSNEGDVSPNVAGAYCIDTGEACDFYHSTCNGFVEKCNGRGPAWPGDHFESTRMIAQRQFQKAKSLFLSPSNAVRGRVDSRQKYVKMADLEVELAPKEAGGFPQLVRTCPAALGFSFAAGTTDGPGAFNFKQGDNEADTLPISVHRIGQLLILGVPGELTTMAGRRLKAAVKKVVMESAPHQFGDGTEVVIAGLANAYSQYITTYEEYAVQRYEGASTLFGPHTLSAYIQEISKLAKAIALGTDVEPGEAPQDLSARQLSFLPPSLTDAVPVGAHFGDVTEDVRYNVSYSNGDVVRATFRSGCPRNDLQTEGTFTAVERMDAISGKWVVDYDDDDWSVKMEWRRPLAVSPLSFATVVWQIPVAAPQGVYRLRHFGAYKHISGEVKYFTGTSSAFVLQRQ